MTPAVRCLERASTPYQLLTYRASSRRGSVGEEAARDLGLDPARVFKTLVVRSNTGSLALAIIPVKDALNLRRLARHLGVKTTDMASPAEAERATGYRLGGISPLATRRPLPTVVDEVALGLDTIYVSAGRRGLEIGLDPRDLIEATEATTAPIRTT
ncbi:MAG: Cys-tRNA(Pro) deacylase [Trueperaceae bacterium]|nr:MAG: Cys-tRNA(Pro) deacylase [Trueperaceae bacterium]